MEKKAVVIGAGISGLCSAYYLNKLGWQVTVVDRHAEQHANCSWGNAGLIVPSHFIPLAAPGVLSKGLRWMFNRSSPFYVRLQCRKEAMRWFWQFKKSATAQHVQKVAPLLRDMNTLSRDLFQTMVAKEAMQVGWQQQGLLMLYRTNKCAEEENHTAAMAQQLGIAAQALDASATAQQLGTAWQGMGSVYYPGDAHLAPGLLMQELLRVLQQKGVQFHFNTEVTGITAQQNKITALHTNATTYHPDGVVLAAGVWSAKLAKQWGLHMPLMPGKGYSISIQQPQQQFATPAILCEAKVAVTPMSDTLRLAGTMELNRYSSTIDTHRVEAIKHAATTYFPHFSRKGEQPVWTGLRPCSPDGLPYIGKGKHTNLVVAAGHAMMGLSLGAVTGKLVSETLSNIPTSLPTALLTPDRF